MNRIMSSLAMSLIVMLSVVISSCEHRELTDTENVRYVRVYTDEQIRNVTFGFYDESYERPDFNRPLSLFVAMASAGTGEIVYQGLLRGQGSDARGNYIDGYVKAGPGEYHMLMYQSGSSITHIRNHGNYHDMQAYTSMVTDRVLAHLSETSKVLDPERIVEEPEHILAGRCENIVISHSETIDTLKTSDGDYFSARSIARSYYLQLRIKGVQWVSASSAVLSGIAGSSRLCREDGAELNDPVNLYFPMRLDGKETATYDVNSSSSLYATFTTFGKIPDMTSELTLNFEFTKSDGSTQVERIDITDAFNTPMAKEKQWILLDKEITIVKPLGSGGVDPGVEGWKEEDADLIM